MATFIADMVCMSQIKEFFKLLFDQHVTKVIWGLIVKLGVRFHRMEKAVR